MELVVMISTFFVTIGGFIIVWLQLGTQIFSTIIGWVQAEEIRETRGRLYLLVEDSSSRDGEKKEYLEGLYKQDAYRVGYVYNNVALVLRNPLLFLSKKSFLRHHSKPIYLCWCITKNQIEARRVENKTDDLGDDFDWLAEKVINYLKRDRQELFKHLQVICKNLPDKLKERNVDIR